MKAYDAYTDDDGVRWEITYDHEMFVYERDESGATPLVAGKPIPAPDRISDFRYRKDGDEEWLTLPPWATVRDSAKITFCFFNEDEETEEMTFWEVRSESAEAPVG